MFKCSIGPDAELALLEERHAEELFELTDRNREHLRPWTPWLDGVRTADDSRAFIRRSLEQHSRGEALVAGIWQDGRLAGVISFDRISLANRSAMMGYWIGADYSRRGLVTRGCQAMIDHGFGEVGLNRIEIWAAADNRRSLAIPERLGFAREGVAREAQWLNDRFVDIATYSLLRSEWSSQARPPGPRTK